uniref:Uncharacterized protein n=2 Tax=Cucumis sativus TaxID=3659 RepID=A0A0A0KPS6_CUCSA
MAVFTAEVDTLTSLKTLRSYFLSNRFEQLNNSTTPFVEDQEEDEYEDEEMFSTVNFICKNKSTFQDHLK